MSPDEQASLISRLRKRSRSTADLEMSPGGVSQHVMAAAHTPGEVSPNTSLDLHSAQVLCRWQVHAWQWHVLWLTGFDCMRCLHVHNLLDWFKCTESGQQWPGLIPVSFW